MTKKEKIRIILRQLNESANEHENNKFSNWLLKDPDNLDLYIEIKKIWHSPLSKRLNFDDTRAKTKLNKVIKKERRKIQLQTYSRAIAAASILLVIVATFAYQHLKAPQHVDPQEKTIHFITKHSELGEQLRVTLPDASVVRLNAGSSIRFPEKFDTDKRQITLSGEAFFEVTKDPNSPFEVKTNNITTTVLGTSFNIKAFEQEQATVTVATGKVEVETKNGASTNKLLLLPNQQAVYNKKENLFKMEEVDSRHYFEWTSGTIRFNNDPLEEVVKILERWYNVKIQLDRHIEKSMRIQGSYTDKKLYTILDGLGYIYNLDCHYTNDNTIIIKPTPQNKLPM
jgi:ferric-dicitrate binding protein FerR (iron transport regulator)